MALGELGLEDEGELVLEDEGELVLEDEGELVLEDADSLFASVTAIFGLYTPVSVVLECLLEQRIDEQRACRRLVRCDNSSCQRRAEHRCWTWLYISMGEWIP